MSFEINLDRFRASDFHHPQLKIKTPDQTIDEVTEDWAEDDTAYGNRIYEVLKASSEDPNEEEQLPYPIQRSYVAQEPEVENSNSNILVLQCDDQNEENDATSNKALSSSVEKEKKDDV